MVHIVFGTYFFRRRKIGARNDFCNACKREGLSELWRSFDWGHVWGIPLLPLGTREHWRCTHCRKDPRGRYKIGNFVKIFALLVFAAFFALSCVSVSKPGSSNQLWEYRVVFGLIVLGLLYSLLKPKRGMTEDERRKAVVPLGSENCVYCRSHLVSLPHLGCPNCRVRIFTS